MKLESFDFRNQDGFGRRQLELLKTAISKDPTRIRIRLLFIMHAPSHRRLFLVVLFVTICVLDVKAQKEILGLSPDKALTQYNLDYWDIDKQMPSNTVLDNVLSSDGYMWIATFDGLVKFDGVKFETFNERTHSSFKRNGVLSLYEDQNQTLWIGSNGGGLIKKQNNKFIVFQDDTIQQSNIITDIKQDQNGLLWLATRKGISQFKDGEFLHDIRFNRLANSAILTLLIDSQKRVWVGTLGDGLFVYENDSLYQFTAQNGLGDSSVRSLFEDSRGNIIIGTGLGLVKYKEKVFTPINIPDNPTGFFVNDILEDPFGALWVATDVGLIKLYNGGIDILNAENGLVEDNLQSLAFDNEGSLWIGSYRRGIFRLKDGKFKNYGKLEGLANDIINVVYEDKNQTWIGTDYGLSLIEGDTVYSYSLGEGYQKNRVRDILRDKKGDLWICTYDGLVKFKNGKVIKRYDEKDGLSSNKLRVIREDSNGDLWIGTGKGLNRMRDEEFKLYGRSEGLKNDFIMSIFEDSQGNLWVGTDGGGLHLLDDNVFKSFSVADGLPSNVIFQLSEDSNQHLWIGTNGGVARYDGKKFSYITYQHGLYSNSVFQVIVDNQGNYWMMTNKGVQEIDKDDMNEVMDEEKASFSLAKTYDQSEGMRSSVVTGASIGTLGRNGEILVPTFKGLTIIDPNRIPINNVKPPVFITGVKINNDFVDQSKSITIPAGNESLEIHYTGLSLYAPDEVRYQYKMEGFDDKWKDVSNRRVAYYTNLPAGEYTFRVKAANNDGIWNEQGTGISLVKAAHFYQNPWFYLLSFFCLLIVGFAVYQRRTRQLKVKNEQLTQLVNKRTLALSNQKDEITEQKEELKRLNTIKDKLFSIVSHDLRGPINSFSGILKLLSTGNITQEETVGLAGNLQQDLNRLKNLLENLLIWAKTQMQGINSVKVTFPLVEIVDENMELFEKEAKKKEIRLSNLISTETIVNADKEMTKLVFRNLINNAIKFTPKNGEVTVQAKNNDQFIEVWVIDTGVGIPLEIVGKLFSKDYHYSKLGTSKEDGSGLGLLLCKEFIEENGGKIWIESEEHVGSTFKFTLLRA